MYSSAFDSVLLQFLWPTVVVLNVFYTYIWIGLDWKKTYVWCRPKHTRLHFLCWDSVWAKMNFSLSLLDVVSSAETSVHTHTHTRENRLGSVVRGKQTSGQSEHPGLISTNTTSSAAAHHINQAAYIEWNNKNLKITYGLMLSQQEMADIVVKKVEEGVPTPLQVTTLHILRGWSWTSSPTWLSSWRTFWMLSRRRWLRSATRDAPHPKNKKRGGNSGASWTFKLWVYHPAALTWAPAAVKASPSPEKHELCLHAAAWSREL